MNPEPLTDIFNFDSIIDDSVVTAADGVLKKMNVISYSRPKPETIQGPQAVKSIKQWLKNGLRLRGGNNGLGFLFFYELMTERLSLRVLPADSPYNWGCLLLRFVNVDDLKSKDVILSLLRILVNNGNMKADFHVLKIQEHLSCQ